MDQVHSWMLVSFLSSKKCCSLYHVEPVFFILSSQSYIGFQIQNCDSIPAKVVFTVFDRGEKKTYWVKYGRILLLNFLPPERNKMKKKKKTGNQKTNGCLGIQRIHFLIIYLSQGKLAGEMSACSSNVIAFLWSLSVDLISQPYKVSLVVSSIFCGQESSGT